MYKNKRYRIHEARQNPTDSTDTHKEISLKLPKLKTMYCILYPTECSRKVLQYVLQYSKYVISLLECV